MENIIEISDLTRSYAYGASKREEQVNQVLRGISFQVRKGEFLSIMGKSGCGKTTLLKVMGMINRPDSGKLIFEGRDTSDLWVDELSDIRRKQIGFVFQDFNLIDSLTVKENILLPKILDKGDIPEAEKEMNGYTELLQTTHLLEKKPYELSVGEKQRTAICRALMNQPKVILADEPTGNLDSKTRTVVMDIFKRINETMGITIVMITHDIEIAGYSERVIFLKDGSIYRTLDKKDHAEYLNQIVEVMLEL